MADWVEITSFDGEPQYVRAGPTAEQRVRARYVAGFTSLDQFEAELALAFKEDAADVPPELCPPKEVPPATNDRG